MTGHSITGDQIWEGGQMHPLFPCHIVTVGEDEVSAEQRIHGTKEYLWNSPTGAYQVLQESFDSQDSVYQTRLWSYL